MAKDVFQVHGISENGRVIFNKAIKRAKLLAFFETLRPAGSGWKPAGRPITGAASYANWGTT
jgi:transposase